MGILIEYGPCHQIAAEIAVVLVGLKPIVDLRRLLNGHEVAHAPFNTLNERRICRCSRGALNGLHAVRTRCARGLFAVQDHRGVHAVVAVVDAADHVTPGAFYTAECPVSTRFSTL